jgi:hypothetical protein
MLIIGEVIVSGTHGSDELTDEEVRGAVGGVLDAYFGRLFGWSLLLAFVGIVVAGAAAALDQKDLENPTRRLRERLTRTPATTAGRAGRAVAAILAGFLIAAQPDLALRVIALLAGAYLVFWGASELLLMLEGPAAGKRGAAARRQRTLRVAGATAAAVVAAIAIGLVLVLDSAEDPETSSLGREGCNGSELLCDLPLDQVMFAGTHNSFSAADSPGWLIANHRRDIPRQLRDGVRLFLIDTHWGVEDAQGRVSTDFEAEQRDRNKVVSALPPEVLASATRLTGRIGLRAGEGGKREVFLCHTTCELGATRLSVALDDYRTFLDRNPGEVVILFVEPYVEPEDFERAIEDAGLDRYVKTLELGEPMPTLGELVEEDRRLVVFAEEDGGDPPWYLEGFAFVQDTPLGATKIEQASCALERGDATSPFLMINHWADVFPPQRKANVPFQTEEFLLKRIRRCERERGLPVSLIATDHYDQGDFLEVVDRINAQRAAGASGN